MTKAVIPHVSEGVSRRHFMLGSVASAVALALGRSAEGHHRGGVASGGGGGGGGQLPAGHFVDSPVTFAFQAPRSGTTALPYSKWPPGVPYSVPVIMVGGARPYFNWSLTGSPPSGMTIGTAYQGIGSSGGIISWANPVAGTYNYTINVQDQTGRTLSLAMTLTVPSTTGPSTGLLFFDAVNGNPSTHNSGTGTGTASNPFKNTADWYNGTTGSGGSQSARKADNAFSGMMCFYSTGTYTSQLCAPFESADTGTATGGMRVPMVVGNKPKVHIAIPGQTVAFDFTYSNYWIYGDTGEGVPGWWVQGITTQGVALSGTASASDLKCFVQDADPSDTMFYNNTFGVHPGLSGANPTPVMFTRNSPDISQHTTVCFNTYLGLTQAVPVECYWHSGFAYHYNTVSNSSEGDGGGCYNKESCANISIVGNVSLVGNTTSLWRLDNYEGTVITSAGVSEVCYNNAITTGTTITTGCCILFGTDGTDGGTLPASTYGIVGVFRNTFQGEFCTIDCTNMNGAITVTADVNIGNGSASQNWSVTTYDGTLSFGSNYLTGTAASNIVDSSGNLLGSFIGTNLGISGHQIA